MRWNFCKGISYKDKGCRRGDDSRKTKSTKFYHPVINALVVADSLDRIRENLSLNQDAKKMNLGFLLNSQKHTLAWLAKVRGGETIELSESLLSLP